MSEHLYSNDSLHFAHITLIFHDSLFLGSSPYSIPDNDGHKVLRVQINIVIVHKSVLWVFLHQYKLFYNHEITVFAELQMLKHLNIAMSTFHYKKLYKNHNMYRYVDKKEYEHTKHS